MHWTCKKGTLIHHCLRKCRANTHMQRYVVQTHMCTDVFVFICAGDADEVVDRVRWDKALSCPGLRHALPRQNLQTRTYGQSCEPDTPTCLRGLSSLPVSKPECLILTTQHFTPGKYSLCTGETQSCRILDSALHYVSTTLVEPQRKRVGNHNVSWAGLFALTMAACTTLCT